MVRSIIYALYLIRLFSSLYVRPDVTTQNRQVAVYDGIMNYIDTGNVGGRTVVFLHGNPTSSYLWRNVIPHVSDVARCLAPDLIGMGKSSKIEGSLYTFQDQYRYLSRWFESVAITGKVDLVIHDWGSGLGFHWARLNSDRVESITYMEAIVGTWPIDTITELQLNLINLANTPIGQQMILQNNIFIERFLPGGTLRNLTEEELNVYREPYLEPGESRRPMLTWPQQLPVVPGGPADVVSFAGQWNSWLANSTDVPKLYIHAEPGGLSPSIIGRVRDWPNQRIVTVRGIHYIQEDSPDEIGRALRDFLLNYVWVNQ